MKYAGEFHAPADSFMIEALGLKDVRSWSKWETDEYDRFQELLKGTIPSGERQLEWEGPEWISVAKKRKKDAFFKLETKYKSEE